MFEVILQQEFSSAHSLRHYHGTTEPLHGHNFRVEVVLRGKKLQNKVKYLVDFMELQRVLQAIIQPMDHVNLNETPPFDRENPSAENLAKYIGEQLARRLPACRSGRRTPAVKIASITVWETPFQAARYLP